MKTNKKVILLWQSGLALTLLGYGQFVRINPDSHGSTSPPVWMAGDFTETKKMVLLK